MAPRKRAMIPPEWSEVKAHFHLQIQDAAKALGVGQTYLRSLCRNQGVPRWPGQQIRSLIDKLQKLAMEAAARQSAPPGQEAQHRPRVMIAKDISEVIKEITRLLQTPNPTPGLQEHISNHCDTPVPGLAQGLCAKDDGLPASRRDRKPNMSVYGPEWVNLR